MNFGFVVKRKTIAKALAFILAVALFFFVFDYSIYTNENEIDLSLTWDLF